jgi:hypothetical protein
MKLNNLTDSTESFIVNKLLKDMSKTYKRADIRRPITVEILADIIRILPQICNSKFIRCEMGTGQTFSRS